MGKWRRTKECLLKFVVVRTQKTMKVLPKILVISLIVYDLAIMDTLSGTPCTTVRIFKRT